MDPNPEGTMPPQRLHELLDIVEPLQPTMDRTLRWRGNFDFLPGVQESVAEHQEDMSAFAQYLFAGFPFEGLTDEVKLQILLINKIHDLDEWEDGDDTIETQSKMTADELASRTQRKRASFVRFGQQHTFPNELIELYDAFENRHNQDETPASWVSPIAVAYSGMLDKVQATVFKTFNSAHPENEDLSPSLERIDIEFKLLSNAVPQTKENIFFLAQLQEHIHKLISTGIFDKKIIADNVDDESSVGSHVPFIVRGKKQLEDFRQGAEALVAMERSIDTLVVGTDIPVVVKGPGTRVLKPGEFIPVRAIIPPDYLERRFPHLSLKDRARATVEALLRNQVAAMNWMKGPVERSTFGQLSGELVVPSFNPRSIEIGEDGTIYVKLVLGNNSSIQQLAFNTEEVQPMFRLFIDPSCTLITGDALAQRGQQIIGDSFDPQNNLIYQGSTPIALRVPVTEYAIQDPSSALPSIDITRMLTSPTPSRREVDEQLGIVDWTKDLHKLPLARGSSIVLGQTPAVQFPSDIVGVISQTLQVTGGHSIARHGGARMIDPGFGKDPARYGVERPSGLPIRTEFQVQSGEDGTAGKQDLVVYLYPATKAA